VSNTSKIAALSLGLFGIAMLASGLAPRHAPAADDLWKLVTLDGETDLPRGMSLDQASDIVAGALKANCWPSKPYRRADFNLLNVIGHGWTVHMQPNGMATYEGKILPDVTVMVMNAAAQKLADR
jgi:hypothetical protein